MRLPMDRFDDYNWLTSRRRDVGCGERSRRDEWKRREGSVGEDRNLLICAWVVNGGLDDERMLGSDGSVGGWCGYEQCMKNV